MRSMIVIPARYASGRFPGKPLAKIAGQTLLQRVSRVALSAAEAMEDTGVLIATDDQRIMDHAAALGVPAVLTSPDCKTGTDRVFAAVADRVDKPDYVINLQGDAPLIPVRFITALLEALQRDASITLVTPVIQLDWKGLDALRHNKGTTPFSGTTAIVDQQGRARWFSKRIIPALRQEAALRAQQALSPVYLHVGLYGYTWEMLRQYVRLAQTPYEQLEELEQLRALERGYPIHTVKFKAEEGGVWGAGVDTPEDLKRIEVLIKETQQ